MTEFELKNEVSKFYNGSITLDKALRLYEFEYGFKPEIESEDYSLFVNEDFILEQNEYILTPKNLVFMKQLQESGSVNMFASSYEVQKQLICTPKDAKKLVLFYIHDYTKIYHPEELF